MNDIMRHKLTFEVAKAAMQGMLAHSRRYKPRKEDKDLHWHDAIAKDEGLHWHDAITKEAFDIGESFVSYYLHNYEARSKPIYPDSDILF